MRELTEIIVHCSATRPEWMQGQGIEAKTAEIRRWHMDGNGWSDIGYHILIDRDGQVTHGRPLSRDGAHCKGHNKGTVGVCLIGGHGSSENDLPHKHYTPKQLAKLRDVIASLEAAHRTIKKVSGHNQYASKACPGFNVARWLDHKTAERVSPAQSTTLQATAATATAGAGAVASVLGSLTPTGQTIVLVCAAVAAFGLAWIARERLKRWARGDR